jgi:hypothetical protein
MTVDPAAVRRAIEQELDDTPVVLPFRVNECRAEGSLWFVKVQSAAGPPSPLDESYEGAQVWWPEPTTGAADVLTVLPEEEELVLRFATSRPPSAGGTLFLYPPRFLEKLLEVWKAQPWADRCVRWAESVLSTQKQLGKGTDPRHFSRLRRAQLAAFDLTGWPVGFLWGPPGTGKTTTVGAILAAYLLEDPNRRILLLSTTNAAVDLALVSVDKSLADSALRLPAAESVRQTCKRIGSHFLPKNYEGRSHLLPQRDPVLVRTLIEHAAKRPDERNAHAYAAWKAQDEQLRLRMHQAALEVLRTSRLSALTTTRAAFDFESLRSLPPFDLVVVDEASQVSLAYAVALAPLGRKVLFAGDPEQLAPIVRSEETEALAWLGRSAFELGASNVPEAATCFLDEQFRMARPICEVVSRAFYQGRLALAEGCESNASWRRERDLDVDERDRVQLAGVTAEGSWSAQFHGPVRQESADHIVTLVKHHLHKVESEDIAVLTPFRAQRVLIRSKLRQAEISGVKVSTVHRAQGSERKIVLFDPVMGGNKFLTGLTGRRLINVALSRAMALLYIFTSPGDLRNPHLAIVASCLGRGELNRTPIFCELANHPDFPQVMRGQVFGYYGMKLAFKELARGGASIVTTEVSTQQRRQISMDGARTACGDPNNCPKGCKPNGTPRTQCVA